MDVASQRWYLLGKSTNPHGVTHYVVVCRDATADEDYEELARVLAGGFGAVPDGGLVGPYSVHRYLRVGGLRLGVVLDEPQWLCLYADDEPHAGAMASLVAKLLDALNGASTGRPG